MRRPEGENLRLCAYSRKDAGQIAIVGYYDRTVDKMSSTRESKCSEEMIESLPRLNLGKNHK